MPNLTSGVAVMNHFEGGGGGGEIGKSGLTNLK